MGDRIWKFLFGWWYRSSRRGYHPQPQPLSCALTGLVLGAKTRGGEYWTDCGKEYWWSCDRCGAGES